MSVPATHAALVEIDGKRLLRTGDFDRCDEEGCSFMAGRLRSER